MQKLIMPINDIKITASINTAAYEKRFGFGHFGTDCVSAAKVRDVYSSGVGQVLGTGKDSVCGNVVAVLYKECYNATIDSCADVVFRYFHLASVCVKAGDILCPGQRIGQYGDTGKYTIGKHLHMEADLDTVNFRHTPSVSRSDYLIGTMQGAHPYKSKENTVRNPMEFLYVKTIYPFCQTYSTAEDRFIRIEDMLPKVFSTEKSCLIDDILSENKALKAKLEKISLILAG